MRYRALGRTGLAVSEIGFGGWGIGGRTFSQTSYGATDDRTSRVALAQAFDHGITFFDTAPAYGSGHSEELIGEALASVRNKVVVSTKAGHETWDRPPDFSAAALVASAERSLGRLRTSYLDVLLLHNPPAEVLRSNDVLGALDRLVTSGKVRSWGVSAKGPVEALEALRLLDVPVVQANFNMMDVRVLTTGLFDEVSRRSAGFIARTPLCFGFLSGTITRATKFPEGDHRLAWSSAQLDNWIDGARDLLQTMAASPGLAGVQAALRFCLSFPEVSTTIPGILTAAEAVGDAAASDLGPMSSEAVDSILAINRIRQFFVAATKAP